MMTAVTITLTLENPASETARQLMAALTLELEGRYDPNSGLDVTRMPELHSVSREGVQFVVAWLDGQPVGCGAIRPIDQSTTEVKRMYVVPQARGLGIARQILAKLESLAVAAGFASTRLETGIRQPEAIALYEQAGYIAIPCYGVYAQTPESRCYEKSLARSSTSSEKLNFYMDGANASH